MIVMATSVTCVGSVSAMEQHLVTTASVTHCIISVREELTQLLELNKCVRVCQRDRLTGNAITHSLTH